MRTLLVGRGDHWIVRARQKTPNKVLRRIREERGETREQFAEALAATAKSLGLNVACTERTVARYEDGDTTWPQMPYRKILSATLGVPFEELGFPARNSTGSESRLTVSGNH